MTICTSCGRENAADARFCSACGARLEAPPPRLGERKLVTVLFADVTGSTLLADRLDAEELREVMSAWFAAVRVEIEAQGGTVEKYIGDAVMAVFGVPAAHEDDPSRALRAALRMRERLVELNEELDASHGIRMEIRIGINTGEAVTTPDPPPGEAMVTGVAVNAAARLEQLAEPGQTVVAERTARAAPGFRFEDLGRRELRGKQEPVRAFLLLGDLPGAETRGLPGMHAPLVGRERELDLLLALQDRVVAERRPHLATIYGDPGVGKSRLVRELLDRLASLPDAPRIVVGRCLSYGDGIAYWPLAEILKSLAGVGDDDPAETAVGRIDALAEEVLADVQDESRVLSTAALRFTLGLDSGSAEFSRLQPSAIRAELHRAWRTLLSSLAADRALVVVVDDIHWADPVLLDLLEELGERAQGPILFVCPSRPELTARRPTWGGGRRNVSAVFLAPLSQESSAELVSHLLDVDGLPNEARGRILERAEGNPFFLEEILRQLIDEGRIVREDGRWRASGDFGALELPDTVQAVLAARIDLLQPSEKHTLQQASVVGRIFWRGAVAALIDDDEGVDPDLRRLEERELVAARLTSTMAGEEELAFSHILTRDVAYESLPRRERPRAHARVASWIERTTGDRRREYVGLLAHHYSEAYRGARTDRGYPADELEALRCHAFTLLLEGSHTALRGAAFSAARSLAESALEIAATPDERARALEALGDGYHHGALGDDALETYVRAAETLVGAGTADPERAARILGLALEIATRWTGTVRNVPTEETAAAHLAEGLRLIGEEGDSEARVRLLTAQAFWGHAFPDSTSPDADAEQALERGAAAAEIAVRLGREDLAVVALDSVQYNLQRLLRYEDAHASAQRRLELARTAGDLYELGDSYAVAAWNAVYYGLLDDARRLGREGFELLIGDAPYYATHALSWSALATFYLGDWDGFLRDFELVLSRLGPRAETPTSGFAAPWPAAIFVHEARGDRERSEQLLAQVLPIEDDRGHLSAHLSPPIVSTLILRGELDAARERLESVKAQREVSNLPLLLLAEADLLVLEAPADELEERAEHYRGTAATSGARYLTPVVHRLRGWSALREGRAADAADLLAAAADGLAEAGLAIHAAVARLDAAEALLAASRPQDASDAVDAALQPLERAGYRRQLERAAELRHSSA